MAAKPAFCLKIILCCLIWLGLVARVRAADLLLLAADEAALQPLLARLEGSRSETRAAWTIWTGRMQGREVVLARTEGDPLNAVAVTTLAVRLHHPRLIVTYGAARAHDPALRPGDLVVSERFTPFDGVVSPRLPLQGGTDPTVWEPLPHLVLDPNEIKEVPVKAFPADASALGVARSIPWPQGRVVAGVLGSASQVNREADRVASIRAVWGTSCEDGESAHIACCASILGVPVIGFRVIDGPGVAAVPAVLSFVEAWR
jgi:adenosylhomocysteine nucleosidase